jgi:hypothetical protein
MKPLPRTPLLVVLLLILAAAGLAGCRSTPAAAGLVEADFSPTPAIRQATPVPSPTSLPLVGIDPTIPPPDNQVAITVISPSPAAASATLAPSPTATLGPDDWKSFPVVPETISERTRAIYQHGLALGNNPAAFSKIGDCGSTPAWFLGDFDRGAEFYELGEHGDLQAVIAAFAGSYERTSLAAQSGMNASSAFVPLWANREVCQPGETPIACEYRVQQPAFVFIMLGTNDVWHPDRFEPQMRAILEFFIENGVVPILSTKADNLEGDGSLNTVIARLAREYDIPLWNFWRAVQELPDGGLQEDGAHLTFGRNFFDDPQVMQRGWPVRNLTALQMLDAVWRGVQASGD